MIVFCFTSCLLSNPGVVGFGVEVWLNYFRSLWKLGTTVCTEDVAQVVWHAAPAAEKLEKLTIGGWGAVSYTHLTLPTMAVV